MFVVQLSDHVEAVYCSILQLDLWSCAELSGSCSASVMCCIATTNLNHYCYISGKEWNSLKTADQ